MNIKWIVLSLIVAIGGWMILTLSMFLITNIPADIASQNGAGFFQIFLLRLSITISLFPVLEPIYLLWVGTVFCSIDKIKGD